MCTLYRDRRNDRPCSNDPAAQFCIFNRLAPHTEHWVICKSGRKQRRSIWKLPHTGHSGYWRKYCTASCLNPQVRVSELSSCHPDFLTRRPVVALQKSSTFRTPRGSRKCIDQGPRLLLSGLRIEQCQLLISHVMQQSEGPDHSKLHALNNHYADNPMYTHVTHSQPLALRSSTISEVVSWIPRYFSPSSLMLFELSKSSMCTALAGS